MNPLTQVKRIQNLNSREAALGISEEASWHAKYKDSAYVFVGGIPFDLTEGDLLAVFAQYGEIVDVNLVRDKGTGKSKGFAFIAYEDQRSTNLAVDNLNGAQILGRTVRVDHVTNYKKKEEEDEETAQQKREARGVCRAFQRGECTRGAGCKFSHDELRAANTGWGQEDKSSKWGHEKFEGPRKDSEYGRSFDGHSKPTGKREEKRSRFDDYESGQKPRENRLEKDHRRSRRYEDEEFELKSREYPHEKDEKRVRKPVDDKCDPKSVDDSRERDRNRSRRHESESEQMKANRRGRDKKTTRDRDSSSYHRKDKDENSSKPSRY